jgi:hypothetical protein
MTRLFLGKTEEQQNQKKQSYEISESFNRSLNLILNISKKSITNIFESCFLSSALNAEHKFQILCFLIRYDIVFGLKMAIKFRKEFPIYEGVFGRASDKISELLLNEHIILKLKDSFLSDLSSQANLIYIQVFKIEPSFIMESKRDSFELVWSHLLNKNTALNSEPAFSEFFKVCHLLFNLYCPSAVNTTDKNTLKESYNRVLNVYLPIIEEIRAVKHKF